MSGKFNIQFFLGMVILILFFLSCSFIPENSSNDSSFQPDTVISYEPVIVINELPDVIDENSGLIFFRNLFWTFNDSGGKAKIYGFNPETGKIEQIITLSNGTNNDWEDITQDSLYIYIGDFGNNFGKRQDLKIYKVQKSRIPESGNVTLKAKIIEFSYSGQENFSFSYKSNSFDCEAFFCLDDTLYLFTKDWINQNSTVYILPNVEGRYIANYHDSFNVNGLITGADISPDKSIIALSGYKDYLPFVWLFSKFKNNRFFSGKKIRINMPELYHEQTEGICFTTADSLFISTEASRVIHRMFFIPVSLWENY